MPNLRTESAQAHDREIERLEGLLAGGLRWLHFPRDLEREFAVDYSLRFVDYRRAVVLAGFVILVCAGALDFLFLRGAWEKVLLLRYWIISPLALAFVLLSRTRRFADWQRPALTAWVAAITAMLFGLMAAGDDRVVLVYSPALMLLAVFAGMLLRIGFWLGMLQLAAIGAAYAWFVTVLRPQPAEIVLAYLLYYVGASLVALFASYHMEHGTRRQFLLDRLLMLKQNELEMANHQLQALVDQDGLTGIANRRHFDEMLAHEWNRARRGGYPLSLLLIDLDFFKHYNDTYGHQAGDDCLIVIGSVLRRHAQRSGDVAARYGGEEFALILPATGPADAAEIGWRVVRDIASYRIPHVSSGVAEHVTASVGVASLVPTPLLEARDLLAAADGALYAAKRNGRNRVEVADIAPPGGGAG